MYTIGRLLQSIMKQYAPNKACTLGSYGNLNYLGVPPQLDVTTRSRPLVPPVLALCCPVRFRSCLLDLLGLLGLLALLCMLCWFALLALLVLLASLALFALF